jgi:hypothetical protein
MHASYVRALAPSAILAATLLLTLVSSPTPADARVNININIGSSLNFGRGITCSDGARIIRNRGFKDVRTVDCRGRYFVYRASRGGSRFEIALQARDGRVADFRRLRRLR